MTTKPKTDVKDVKDIVMIYHLAIARRH